jgi:hypothetical protein
MSVNRKALGQDTGMAHGYGEWFLLDELNEVVDYGDFENIITAYGQRMYWERGAAVSGYPEPPTGMRLGTGNTATALSGAGSALTSYLTGSARAFSALPVSSVITGGRKITYEATWPLGVATGTITEAVITNESPLTDIPGIDANTIARVVFSTPIVKGSGSGLLLHWYHTLS